jgi:hypothetical protein
MLFVAPLDSDSDSDSLPDDRGLWLPSSDSDSDSLPARTPTAARTSKVGTFAGVTTELITESSKVVGAASMERSSDIVVLATPWDSWATSDARSAPMFVGSAADAAIAAARIRIARSETSRSGTIGHHLASRLSTSVIKFIG